MTYTRRCPCLLIVVLLVGTAGCGKEAVNYNNAMVKVTKGLEEVGKQFGHSVAQSKGDMGKLKESHAKAVKEMEKLVQEGRALKVPSSPQADEMNQAFLAFLKVEEKVIRDDFAQMITHIASKNEAALKNLGNQMETAEKTAGQNLKDAQVKFAKANNFKLQ